MKARIYAVQRALWALVLASLVLGVLAFPRGHNAANSAALSELSAFEQGFKQAELETSLLQYARAQGLVPLVDVTRHVTGPIVPEVQSAANAGPIVPLAELQLRSLADVLERSQRDSTLEIGTIAAEPLGAAVAWRLARIAGPPRYTLLSITLEPARFTPEQIALELEVAQLRLDTRSAEKAATEAAKKLTSAEELFDARRKRKLPWKILVKSDDARKEARVILTERQSTFDSTRTRYEAQAQRAEATAAPRSAAPHEPSDKLPGEFATALVLLEGPDASRTTLRVPVALTVRKANLPTLAGTNFAATREAGLWDEVKNGTATAAVARTREQFTWHYRYAEIAGLRVGGMTLLQILPCLLPLLLLALLSRIRDVRVSYNPFGARVEVDLPRVGLGSRPMELCALVVLPLVAIVLTGIALVAVSQLPIVPVIAGLAVIGLGVYAFVELGTLQSLCEAVVRSHSNPPGRPAPAPEAPSETPS